ncbi:MAG: alpha-amylase family glycosyl hydrolase [Acidimicrobiales bacterium]
MYPRSFCDANSDGVGDLEGIRRRLDHLSWLGVDAVWLSPFYRSPMADFGYDVSDFCDVDPLFGTLADFDRLAMETHARGMRLIVDWVPNHTSDRHPWFVEARAARHARTRDWYRWRDDRPDSAGGSGPPGSPGRRPNNWLAAFPGVGGGELPSAWTWDPASGQWYLHLFLAEQPDLNWDHPELRRAMADTLRFWLARGVDGFRVDVAHGLGKDPALADQPPELARLPRSGTNDDPRTHPLLGELRRLVEGWPAPPERLLVGEVYLPTTAQVAAYYGTPERPELHLAFNFPPMFAPWEAGAWRRCIEETYRCLDPVGGWPTWVLSNHDQRRHRSRYGSEGRARAAAVLLLTLRGTPFLFAGEELALADAEIPAERRVDPGGRDGCRAPIPWDPSPAHGWAGGPDPWLPWPPEAGTRRTAEEQRGDPSSTLALYRALLSARRASRALRSGDFAWLGADAAVLAWVRAAPGGDRRAVGVNFSSLPARFELPVGSWAVEVTSADPARHGRVVGSGAWTLEPDEAVILRPA